MFMSKVAFRCSTCSLECFFVDGKSVFTQKVYPTIYKQTGIHFFNIPCQSTNWYSRTSCPNSNQCQSRQCSDGERRVDELKCNIPVCSGQDLCIPVYYTPDNLKDEVKLIFNVRRMMGTESY